MMRSAEAVVISWCFIHASQVIRTWEHPLLKDLDPPPNSAWCDVGDYLRDRTPDVYECSIGEAAVVALFVDRQRYTIEGDAPTPPPVR